MVTFTENQTFRSLNLQGLRMERGEYHNCTFLNCNFERTDLATISFAECRFVDCNLSNVILQEAAFKDVVFKDCKLLGFKLNECNPFLLTVQFQNCQLDFSSFFGLKIRSTLFDTCNLKEADFTQADLTHSRFDNCDLSGVVFENSILEMVDFRGAFNFEIDPEINRLKKAKFERNNLHGLLGKYKIEIY